MNTCMDIDRCNGGIRGSNFPLLYSVVGEENGRSGNIANRRFTEKSK